MGKEFIYIITCSETGRRYVGKTITPKKRFAEHMSKLKRGVHSSKTFQEDYNKFGKETFSYEVVDQCELTDTESRELKWMEKLSSFLPEFGYNDADTMVNPTLKKLGLPIHSVHEKGKRLDWIVGRQSLRLPSDVCFDSVGQDEQTFYTDYLNGMNLTAIAKEHHVSTTKVSDAIRHVLDENDYELIDGCPEPVKKTDTRLKEAIRMANFQIKLRQECDAELTKARKQIRVLKLLLEENGIEYASLIKD